MYINNTEFALQNQTLTGKINLDKLDRVKDLFEELSGELTYTLVGNIDKTKRPILNLKIYGKIWTLCQNCLEKLMIDINHHGSVAIFNNESDLDKALFGEEEEYNDGILRNEEFDVLEFIEDEIIMFLPVSPRHESCATLTFKDDMVNPFSILKQ